MADINKQKEQRTALLGRVSTTGRRAVLLAMREGSQMRFFRARKYLPGQPLAGLFTRDGLYAECRFSAEGRLSFDLSSARSRKLAGKLSTAAGAICDRFEALTADALAAQTKAIFVVPAPNGWDFQEVGDESA